MAILTYNKINPKVYFETASEQLSDLFGDLIKSSQYYGDAMHNIYFSMDLRFKDDVSLIFSYQNKKIVLNSLEFSVKKPEFIKNDDEIPEINFGVLELEFININTKRNNDKYLKIAMNWFYEDCYVDVYKRTGDTSFNHHIDLQLCRLLRKISYIVNPYTDISVYSLFSLKYVKAIELIKNISRYKCFGENDDIEFYGNELTLNVVDVFNNPIKLIDQRRVYKQLTPMSFTFRINLNRDNDVCIDVDLRFVENSTSVYGMRDNEWYMPVLDMFDDSEFIKFIKELTNTIINFNSLKIK